MRKIREGFVKEMELGSGLIRIRFANRQTDAVTNKGQSNNQMGADHLFVLFFYNCLFISQIFIEMFQLRQTAQAFLSYAFLFPSGPKGDG